MEQLSDGAREVIREKISEEVRRQYLEVTWEWFEDEALPEYLRCREKTLWEKYEKRFPEARAPRPQEELQEHWRDLLSEHLKREETWLRQLFEKSTEENIENTIRNLCAHSPAGELKNVLENLKRKSLGQDLLSDLRRIWAEQFQPT